MNLIRSLCVATTLWLCAVSLVRADDATPVPVAAPTAVLVSPEPVYTPPAAVTSVPTVVAPPVADTSPVVVSKEHSTPVIKIEQPGFSTPVAGPETAPTRVVAPPTWAAPATVSPSPQSPSSVTTLGTGAPPDLASTLTAGSNQLSSPDATSLDLSTSPSASSAQAPAQLVCSGKRHPTAQPFLIAPYSGWTEVASFVDHYNPDYSVDGKIVLANGLTATAADGQASDAFPAYWSPVMRQYLSYDGHNGYDLELSYQPLLAAADGTVEYAGWNSSDPYSGYGQMVLINHHNGYVTLYGHLSKLEVQTGDHVIAGQEIGVSGTTGRSSGPHLHFSVFHDCHVTDPYGWTGAASDPLTSFNGERAAYLWLPGHDPLLLNPPPNWPTYPLGLHPTLPSAISRAGNTRRHTPSVDRLLLLSLPTPSAGAAVTTAVALARTEASITQEAEALTPQLDELQAQGRIDSYQVVPAAAAIWIRGRASAAQLEGMPGAASLTGARQKDLEAAQVGLAHAILIQVGRQEAPSLWPVGFRSDLHVWRPVATVMVGHALVAGLARPGEHVIISLHRRAAVPGVAETNADPSTGGFVVMLHDSLGRPVAIRSGDTVQVDSGGRTARVHIQKLWLHARSTRLDGAAASNTTFGLTILHPNGDVATRVTTTGRAGLFRVQLRTALAAGGMAVASVADAAGDQLATSAFVPGVDIVEGGAVIRGWTVGRNPTLRVFRNHRLVESKVLRPVADGTFAMELERAGVPWTTRPGDVIEIGSRAHHHRITLPTLSTGLTLAVKELRLRGPAYATIQLRYVPRHGTGWSRPLTLNGAGTSQLAVPSGHAASGDLAILSYVSPTGDTIELSSETDGIIVHQGSAYVTGHAKPGSVFSVRGVDQSAITRATGLANIDPITGLFRLRLRTATGRVANVLQIARLVVHQGGRLQAYDLPHLSVRFMRSRAELSVQGPSFALLVALMSFGGNSRRREHLTTSTLGVASVRLSATEYAVLRRVQVTWIGKDGLTVERTVSVPAVPQRICATTRSVRASTAVSPTRASCPQHARS